jgi:hypothetical protein
VPGGSRGRGGSGGMTWTCRCVVRAWSSGIPRDTLHWLAWLVRSRATYVMPYANALGYNEDKRYAPVHLHQRAPHCGVTVCRFQDISIVVSTVPHRLACAQPLSAGC